MSGDEEDKKPDAKLPHSHRPRRRSGSETRQRGMRMTMRLSDAEAAIVKASASRSGLSLASYGRAQMLANPTTRATQRPSVERAALSQVLAQLGKCGSNLNQTARVLNSGGTVEMEIIVAAIDDFRAACAAVMRALGRPYGEDIEEASP